MASRQHALREVLRRHSGVVDLALGVLVAGLGVLSLWSPPDFVDFDFRDPDALGVALAVSGGAAVAARSRFPVPALGVAAVASLTLLQLGYSQSIGGLPALLTLYSVAVARPARTSGACTAATLVLVSVVLLTGPFEPTFVDWIANTLVLVTGWALGRSVRGRRAHAASLEERNRALTTARESEMRTALVEERSRIAREMQDLVAHSLTEMTVQAAAVRRVLRHDPETAEAALAAVETTGRSALAEMRRILGVLAPEGGPAERRPQPGIGDLEDLVEKERSAGRRVTFASEGAPGALEPGAALAAYRIVQEALANARRHAGPNVTVRVALCWTADAVRLQVDDDGLGPRPRWGRPVAGGQGLARLQERVGLYGGSLRTARRRGGGFELTATLPTMASRAPASTPASTPRTASSTASSTVRSEP